MYVQLKGGPGDGARVPLEQFKCGTYDWLWCDRATRYRICGDPEWVTGTPVAGQCWSTRRKEPCR